MLITNATVTSYRSIKSQTDNSPFYTSIGEHTNVHGVAVSQDLLKQNGGPLSYGDLVYVEKIGYKFVNDCMAKRMHNHIDIWVEEYSQEKEFDKKWAGKRTRIWLIKTSVKQGK